tara:strand:+ start:732 stop:1157 length:426 start_codon:yes stop_codon:yes gene_type:complete
MAKNTLTFDPSSGVAYGVNLTINTGADLDADYTVVGTSGTAFDFSSDNAVAIGTHAVTDWTGSAQLAKSIAIGSSQHALATFEVGFTSAKGGEFRLSLGSTVTRTLSEGRYVYDVLVSSGASIFRIVSGDVMVIGGISSAP